MDKKLVFFDAECLVCNRFGRFLLKHSSDIYLAPLGGATYQSLRLPTEIQQADAIVYWNGKRAFLRTEAIREIARHMGGFWQGLALLSRLLPTRMLNFFYDRFARIRYRVFGRVESCSLIPPEYRSRLLKD